MADRKISELTALTTQASGDLLPIVDVSEAAAADKNKSITVEELFQGIPVNVGIGETSPDEPLHITASDPAIKLQDSDGTNQYSIIKNASGNSIYDAVNGTGVGGAHIFRSPEGSGNEHLRIDNSGRLLVGTTSASSTSLVKIVGKTTGAGFGGTLDLQNDSTSTISGSLLGSIFFTNGDENVFGQIQCFGDGNSGTGDYPGRLVFSTTADGASSPTEHIRIQQNGAVRFSNTDFVFPNTDNAVGLGYSGKRYMDVWAANGTIQTSDERAKTEIADANLGADFIKSLRPVSYKWIEGQNVDTGKRDEDGNWIYEPRAGVRTHWGFIAQEVKQAVDVAGVDFAGWVLTDKDDPDSEQALRYDQFIAPLTKALQEALAKIETLEQRLSDAGIA